MRGIALDEAGVHDIVRVHVAAAFKLCLVAEGKADLYPRLGLTSEWDTAAAHAIVNAAGGQVIKLTGEELQYNKENLLNPWFIVCNAEYDWLPLFKGILNDDLPA